MVDDAEGVDQIERLHRNDRREIFGVADVNRHAIGEPKQLDAPSGKRRRLLRQLDRGDARAGAGKADGIGADAAADLEHAAVLPARELRETGDVRLDEIFPALDLVEVLARAHGPWRVMEVAGTRVPEVADALDRHARERVARAGLVHALSLYRPMAFMKGALRRGLAALGVEVWRIPRTGAPRHSYFDEERILQELLRAVPARRPFYVDIGAGNGELHSNTVSLARSGWSGFAVECDGARF